MPFSNEIEIAVDALPSLPSAAGDLVRATIFGTPDFEALQSILADSPRVLECSRRLNGRSDHGDTNSLRSLSVPRDYALLYAASVAFAPVVATQTDEMVDASALLRHSIASMFWSHIIRREIGLGDAWIDIAALLHDVGIAVLNNVSRHNLSPCLQAAARSNLALVDAERQFYDPNHAEIGAMLCTSWMLPYRFAECIASHHDNSAGGSEASDCIRLAEALAIRTGYPEFAWALQSEVKSSLYPHIAPTMGSIRRLLKYRSWIDAEVNAVMNELSAADQATLAA